MNDDEAQTIWRAYYQRIRDRRVSEAEQLITATRQDGINDHTEMFLDFRHFSSVETNIARLKDQLAENYEVSLSKDDSSDCWFLEGTTRPISMPIEREQIIEWVKFMADVAQSHACVFSTWTLTEASTGRRWPSETFEDETE